MNLLQKIEKEHCEQLAAECPIIDFSPGDTIRVITQRTRKVQSDKKGKTQAPVFYTEKFQGICIAKTNKGIGSSFRVKRIVNNMAVELRFPLYGTKVELIDRGVVRRAKLYYLRPLRGNKAKVPSLRDRLSRQRTRA